MQASIVADFAKSYGFQILGIPVDGKPLPFLNNKPDTGQSERLAVKSFPALLLVSPADNSVVVITYEYLAREDLLNALIAQTTRGNT